ncbi:MAG: hypothetical protein R2851_25420 [Caldilineaceae bacterium]
MAQGGQAGRLGRVLTAKWQAVLAELGMDMDRYAAGRARWTRSRRGSISAGLKKQFLVEEYVNTYKGGVVDDCREHCFSAGIWAISRSSGGTRSTTPGAAPACMQ